VLSLQLWSSRLTEKSVAKGDGVNSPHGRIFYKIRVDKEEYRHVHGLASIQSLLLKTEALDLAKVWGYLRRGHTVCGDPYDIPVALVRCGEESQCCFTREDSDFALLRRELPRQDIGNIPFERDTESTGISDWLQSLGRILARVMGFDRLTRPACLLANLYSVC
jgi:hypothetical protein